MSKVELRMDFTDKVANFLRKFTPKEKSKVQLIHIPRVGEALNGQVDLARKKQKAIELKNVLGAEEK